MRLVPFAIFTVALHCFFLLAQKPVSSSATTEKLGNVSFPISCSSAVRPEFDRAVALLHSFQYALAESSFGRVAEQEPQCAMAYWGEAMGLYHQLWNWPDEDTLKKGQDYIEQALKVGAKTDRERSYIRAAADFYQSNPKMEPAARIGAYSAAMAETYRHYPEDSDATAFYALSQLALDREGSPGARKEAVAILTELLTREPNHPGAAHYLIHATDTTELAPQGLLAARRYAEIAPSSAHALHMPSHIFSRVGLWKESIESNVASSASAEYATRTGHDDQSQYQLHAMHYLLYAYLQMGRDGDAKRVIEGVGDIPKINDVDRDSDGSLMKAIYIMETHRWEEASELVPKAHTDSYSRMRIHWVRAIAESRLGNIFKAEEDLDKLRQDFSDLRRNRPSIPSASPLVLEAEAWLAHVRGKEREAVKIMREAVKVDEFSVDAENVPANELLGDLLLNMHESVPAREAYDAALKEAPNRFNSLYGAARAAQLGGDEDLAKSYFARLVAVADPGTKRPELQAAKEYLYKSRGMPIGS